MITKPKRVRALKPQQLKFVDLVLAGQKPTEAAAAVGLDPKKSYRLMANARVAKLLQDAGVKPPERPKYDQDAALIEIDDKIAKAEASKGWMAVRGLIAEKLKVVGLYAPQKVEVAQTIDLSAALKAAMARVAAISPRPMIEAKLTPAIDAEVIGGPPDAEKIKVPKPPSLMQEQIAAAQERIKRGSFDAPAATKTAPMDRYTEKDFQSPKTEAPPSSMPKAEPAAGEDAQFAAWQAAESARGFHHRQSREARKQAKDVNYGIFD